MNNVHPPKGICRLLSLVTLALSSLASASTLAREYRDCATDRDCQRGWMCDVQSVPCETNPQASECVRKVCMPDTQPPAPHIKMYPMAAVLESGPDDSPALRIQLATTTTGNTVWTVLYGETWRRVLNGERQVKASIRTCTDWGTPRSTCRFHDGGITFTAPVSNKVGATVQGNLQFKKSPTAQEVVLPFMATVRPGISTGDLVKEKMKDSALETGSNVSRTFPSGKGKK